MFYSRKLEQATYESVAFRYISADRHPARVWISVPVADAVRIKLKEDRRCSPRWRVPAVSEDYYDERGAVERVDSRLAGAYGFEHPFIRGLAKMRPRMTMALTIMLAMAIGLVQAGQPEHLRRLVKIA